YGNEKNIQRAGLEKSFLYSSEDFRREIVNICLKFGDLLRCFVFFKLAEHCAQNVGSVRQISPSHAIANLLGSHCRQEAHRVLELGDDRSACRSDQLERNGNLRDGDAFEYFQGRRGGQRILPMIASKRALSVIKTGKIDAFNAKGLDSNRRENDVHD